MVHVVVVRRDQHFVSRLERQAVIDEREPCGRIRRQRDLFRAAAEIGGDVPAHLALEVLRFRLEHPPFHDEEGILVEGLPEGVDRRAHRRRMRRDVEARQMHVVGHEAELRPDLPPVVETRHGRGARLHRGEQPARQEAGAERGTVESEEGTT